MIVKKKKSLTTFDKKKSVFLFLLLSSLVNVKPAFAEVVKKIKIEGNNTVSESVILRKLPIRVGDDISGDNINLAVKKLYSESLFSNVNIAINNNVLVVRVEEQNIINNVLFEGNGFKKNADLLSVMRLKSGSAYSAYSAALDEKAIQNLYASQGYDNISISIRPVVVSTGSVDLVVKVEEGEQAKIERVIFEGNSSFSENQLRDVIVSKASGFLSFLKKDDIYTKEKIEVDKQVLQFFYQQRGFIDFYVASVDAVLNPETKKYVLTYKIVEGNKYTYGDIEINSFVEDLDMDEIRSLLTMEKGEDLDVRQLEYSQLAINRYLVRNGRPFVGITQSTKRNLDTNTLDVTYNLVQSPVIYINRIVIKGNNKTRDWVIRDELNVSEGDAFNKDSWQSVRRRLLSLGFFSNVDISLAQTNQPDRVNVIIDVVEQETGQISVSAGYIQSGNSSDTAGANLQASLSQANFLGRGEGVSLVAGLGQNKAFNGLLSYSKPNILGYPVAGTVSLSASSSIQSNLRQKQLGASASLSFPVMENVAGSLSYNLAREVYEATGNVSKAAMDATKHSPWYRSSLSYGLTYSTIDNYVIPRSGSYLKWQQELAGLGGDAKFLKTTVSANYVKPLSTTYDIIGMIRGGAGFVAPISSQGLRLFDLFKNNTFMLRGFDLNGIGPEQENSHLGGTTYLHANAEIGFPIPYIGDTLNLRGAVFVDAATLFGNYYRPSSDEAPMKSLSSFLRVSTGVSLIWHGPFGPFRVDFGFPIRKLGTDTPRIPSIGISNYF